MPHSVHSKCLCDSPYNFLTKQPRKTGSSGLKDAAHAQDGLLPSPDKILGSVMSYLVKHCSRPVCVLPPDLGS